MVSRANTENLLRATRKGILELNQPSRCDKKHPGPLPFGPEVHWLQAMKLSQDQAGEEQPSQAEHLMPFYQPQASISHPVNFYEQLGSLGNRRVPALGEAKFQPPGALDTRLGQGQLSSP